MVLYIINARRCIERVDTDTKEHTMNKDEKDRHPEVYAVLAKEVKAMRHAAGISQRELGDRIGLGTPMIRKIEQGGRTPLYNYIRIAQVTGHDHYPPIMRALAAVEKPDAELAS